MTVESAAEARTRLRAILVAAFTEAGRLDVQVNASSLADLADGPAVFTAGMDADVSAEYLAQAGRRYGFTWRLTLTVFSKRYHPTAAEAEAEAAALAGIAVDAVIADPELRGDEGEPPPGLERAEPTGIELHGAVRPEAAAGQPVGADQWEAMAEVTVAVHIRGMV